VLSLQFSSLNRVSWHPPGIHTIIINTDFRLILLNQRTGDKPIESLVPLSDYALSDSPRWDTCQARNRAYACCCNWLKVCCHPFWILYLANPHLLVYVRAFYPEISMSSRRFSIYLEFTNYIHN
jgi:hypothetical protein